MKILLFFVLLFSWSGTGQDPNQDKGQKPKPEQESGSGQEQQGEQEEGPYIFQHMVKKVNVTYQMPDYLHFSMEGIRNSVEMIWRKPFHKIPLKELFEKSRKGDPVCNLFWLFTGICG